MCDGCPFESECDEDDMVVAEATGVCPLEMRDAPEVPDRRED